VPRYSRRPIHPTSISRNFSERFSIFEKSHKGKKPCPCGIPHGTFPCGQRNVLEPKTNAQRMSLLSHLWRLPKPSATDLTAKTFFERLFLVLGRDCLDYLKNKSKSGDIAFLELTFRNVSLGKHHCWESGRKLILLPSSMTRYRGIVTFPGFQPGVARSSPSTFTTTGPHLFLFERTHKYPDNQGLWWMSWLRKGTTRNNTNRCVANIDSIWSDSDCCALKIRGWDCCARKIRGWKMWWLLRMAADARKLKIFELPTTICFDNHFFCFPTVCDVDGQME